MPGVPREVIEHSLNIKEGAKPVKQRLRRFTQDRKEAIGDELTKLMVTNFIKEVYHPNWLANPVLVKKKNGKWRMCVDYTDLNKACPKIHLDYRASIRLWIPQPGATYCAFLMLTQDTTRSAWLNLTASRY